MTAKIRRTPAHLLAALFLLSTGDDAYLPRAKAYFDAFPDDVQAIGKQTWNNCYNGIAAAEYYLRTTFDVDALDHDAYRLTVLARQGFGIHLNGHRIDECVWWKDQPHCRMLA